MELKPKEVLKRLGNLEREIEYLKRDLLHVVEQPSGSRDTHNGRYAMRSFKMARKSRCPIDILQNMILPENIF
jgi:hypothetical protein